MSRALESPDPNVPSGLRSAITIFVHRANESDLAPADSSAATAIRTSSKVFTFSSRYLIACLSVASSRASSSFKAIRPTEADRTSAAPPGRGPNPPDALSRQALTKSIAAGMSRTEPPTFLSDLGAQFVAASVEASPPLAEKPPSAFCRPAANAAVRTPSS